MKPFSLNYFREIDFTKFLTYSNLGSSISQHLQEHGMAMQIYVSIKLSLQHPRDISTDFYAKDFPQILLSSHGKKDFLLAPMCSVYHHNLNKRQKKRRAIFKKLV